MGLSPGFLGLLNTFPPTLVLASHFHTMCKIWLHIYRQKLLLAHGGGGGDDILKMFSDFYILYCKTDCSTQNFTSLKHLIWKMDFTVIKYSGQGSFTVKKVMIDKLLLLLKTIGIYP